METPKLTSAIKEFADESIKFAQIKLRTKGFAGKKRKTDNTKSLSKGLTYQLKETESGLVLEFISKEDYGIFIEYGVDGNGSDVGVVKGSKYKFKSSTKFANLEAIEQYVRSGKFRLMKTFIGSGGKKVNTFVAKTPENVKSATFAIARSIALKGIKGIGFMEKGMNQAWGNMEKEVQDAFLQDVTDFTFLKFKEQGFNVTKK